ncbi:MAG: AMP-binding protein [Chloroflexi bacterium]|nr:AMP-binding protein [Chloroflexota bacterium]
MISEKQAQAKVHFSVPYEEITEIPADQNTIPKAFVKTARKSPNRVAMRKKRYGIWQEYTWAQSLQSVIDLSLGLVSLGLKREDKVAIIGENDPEFYWAQYAVQAAGGVTTAIFTDANLQELGYIANHSDAVFLIAHDQEQVDKAQALRDQLPNIRNVIYWDDSGMWKVEDPWLLRYEDVQKLGELYGKEHPDAFEKMLAEGKISDIALFSYTSGTSGVPKGAMIRHQNVLYTNWHTQKTIPIRDEDQYLSFSPLAWITEQGFGVGGHALYGFCVNFPEGPETTMHDLREIAPSSLLFPSRIWEGLARTMQMRVNDSFWINRALFGLCLPIAYKVIDLEDQGKAVPAHLRALRWLSNLAVLGPLRDKIGMTRMRNAFTSGSALSPSVLRFFRAVGVELKSLYGSTEMQGVSNHCSGRVKLSSVGEPVPGVKVKIAEDGEIRVFSRAVFSGYYKMPDKTAEAFDEEGYFKSGDAGTIDADGQLVYLDRVKDMIQLRNGERFSPQYIEGRLKFCQFVQDVMAIGEEDKDYVTAIVIIDFENVSRWAEKNRVHFTTYVDLTQKSEVYKIIKDEVHAVNASLPPSGRIRRFVILHKAFDADEAELTRTRKLRRSALEQRYAELIEAMYTGKDKVSVTAEVKYRDGRSGRVETAVRIEDVE